MNWPCAVFGDLGARCKGSIYAYIHTLGFSDANFKQTGYIVRSGIVCLYREMALFCLVFWPYHWIFGDSGGVS